MSQISTFHLYDQFFVTIGLVCNFVICENKTDSVYFAIFLFPFEDIFLYNMYIIIVTINNCLKITVIT